MIHLQLQPEIEAQLAAEAQAHGLPLDRYVEGIVRSRPIEQPRTRSIAEAIDRILELRESTSLGALSFKDLISEGRKY